MLSHSYEIFFLFRSYEFVDLLSYMKVFSNFIQDMLMPQIIDFDTTY